MKKKMVFRTVLCCMLVIGMTGTYIGTAIVCASEERNFDEDVKNGLLYSNEEGKITDKDGNVIPEYDDIEVEPNGGLLHYGDVMQCYVAGAGGKIVFSIPEPVDYGDEDSNSTPEVLEWNITTGINYVDNGVTDVYGEFMDDGNYFDEVVSNAWFGDDGMPLAKYPPIGVRKIDGEWWKFYDEERGRFCYTNIDDAYDLDTVKRSSDTGMVYSMLVKDVQKYTDADGSIYLQGTEYYSGTPVILKGNFGSTVLNGDDLLAFTKLIGLASDDTPNFRAFYAEIDNGRF